jgi:spore coat protein CotH
LDDFKDQKIDFSILQKEFCKTEEEIKQEEEAKKKKAKKETKTVMVVDGKKINDVGIQLSAFPFTAEETSKALIDLDDLFLD